MFIAWAASVTDRFVLGPVAFDVGDRAGRWPQLESSASSSPLRPSDDRIRNGVEEAGRSVRLPYLNEFTQVTVASVAQGGVSGNTVQVANNDGVETVPLWLRPVMVFGAFDVPANILALGHMRIRPRPSMWEQASTKLLGRICP